ncbi:efflux RND transporter periplasmic adaptor subunit [Solimonas sp. SE-A11]|uniref:efflux RND transporter periplasmic adaptor subunit n=1 Tax=Solimonas sp. SE-A11 TaxID=3054954 RepID=UPI00259CC962|nr:efflux RND transporter periplasmic adaptor subunit [Solimonas sp. SE-A11]MDM4771682.1 efflux RND transporter periplasmic adaptor subunit [Solimonas sp. SE-A11]
MILRRFPTLLLLSCLSLSACDKAQGGKQGAAKAAKPPVAVESAAVTTATLSQEIVAVGSVRSDESVTLSPEIAGRISRVGFEEGRPVTRGQVLFELDAAVHRAQVGQATAEYTLAQRNYQRGLELFERKLISQQERDTLASAQEAAAASLALAQAQLAKTLITAPFSGVAGLRQVSPGDYVNPGQALVNLEAMSSVKIDFRVPELALPQLSTGQPLDIEFDAWPGERFRGEVYAIEPRVADTTRSVGLRARLANAEGRLRPGLFARIRLQTGAREQVIVVPEQAVFPRGEQQFVYVIADGLAREREIKLGQRQAGRAEVTSGLKAGETIVTSGLQKVSNGASVVSARQDQASPPP